MTSQEYWQRVVETSARRAAIGRVPQRMTPMPPVALWSRRLRNERKKQRRKLRRDVVHNGRDNGREIKAYATSEAWGNYQKEISCQNIS